MTVGRYDLEMPRAIFDETREYRYLLRRFVQVGEGRLLFVPVNPSKADESLDDPSVRRMIGFARAWGFGMLEIVNIFALRATNPRELYEHPEPIGPENDEHIRAAVDRAGLVVCAWGNHGKLYGRGAQVLALIQEHLRTSPWLIRCLGVNDTGEPRHPLYVPHGTGPMTYPRPSPAISTKTGDRDD